MHHIAPSICVFTTRATIGFRSILKGITFSARERGWAVRTVELGTARISIDEILGEWQPIGSLGYALPRNALPESSVCVHINPKESVGGAWTVCHDSRVTGSLAARELLKLVGRTYAFVGDSTNAPWSRIRGEHFVRTLEQFGLACTVCDISRSPDDPLREQRALRHWIESLDHPSAVFAANDNLAESVLAAALAAGLKVPDDLAILGVDNDTTLCENAPVTLSSIAPDFFRGGVLGCELLDRRLNDPKGAPRTPTYYGDLGVTSRASTRLLLKQNALVAQMREFIRLHAAEGITAADVIRKTGRLRRGVELAFRSATGKSIGEELQDVRVELAQRALADDSLQIGEIAGLVGYVSQNQLERLFRRTYGMTMREYRRTGHHPVRAES